MPDLGFTLLLLTLIIATLTCAFAVVSHHKKKPHLLVAAEFGTYTVFGLLSAASMVLVYLFVADDYSVKYVQHYSDRSMPLFYKATAFWGGQDGSLLFWVWVMSIWAAIAVFQNRRKNRAIMPYTIVAMMVVTLFFIVLMLFAANPFETYLAGAPTDGRGLNPLLQNYYMVIHPPSLYLGYIGWTIPFCFAMGALAHNKLDYTWIASMRRWCLVAWVFLTVGLTLGGLWAYEELGWGGYWAWDPVENAAFFPWLTGTAFIHSIQVQERLKIFKGWNVVLIVLTFILTLWGTMMTRSGIVQSVHAFAQSDIGDYFIWFLAGCTAVATALIILRSDSLKPERYLQSIFSREFAFLLNNWVLLASAFFVVFATMFSSIFKFFAGREVNVGPAFFNMWMIPIGLMLLFLCGVGPLLSWGRSSAASVRNQFLVPVSVFAVAALLLAFGLQVYNWKPLLTLSLCAFVTASIVQEFWRGTRVRMKNSGESAFDSFMNLMLKAKRRYGGYVVHFGAVLMFVGFAGESFKLEQETNLAVGEVTEIGRYKVRMDGLRFEDDGQKNMITADVSVGFVGEEGFFKKMAPAKWMYRKPEGQPTTEVDKHMTIRDDLYMVLGNFDAESTTAALQLKVNPLVNFVWLGCVFCVFGFGVSIWPSEGQRSEKSSVLWFRLSPAYASISLFVLATAALLIAVA